MNVKTTIQWATPYSAALIVALALAALAAYALLRRASGRPIAPARRTALTAIRLFTLAAVALILLNPVRVDETPGAVERPKVFYLVDASRSMALGKGTTRWDQVVRAVRDSARDAGTAAQVSVFRFGGALAAVDAPLRGSSEPREAAGPARPAEPTDSDTLLSGALESLSERFGQTPPRAVVVFSDGRARDPERADAVARAYGTMKVPVHAFPVGDADVGGDVAVVSMVAPTLVRKHSRVAAQVFVRSHGYEGKRSELKLVAVGPDGKPGPVLATAPVVLRDGLTPYTLAFESGDQDRRIEARIDPRPGEVSSSNNAFGADLAIDHTKIRVLYLEGATDRFVVRGSGGPGVGGLEVRGAYSSLQDALMEDPDVECTAVMPAGAGGDFSTLVRADERGRGLPETPSELFAYDAILLSNVPREALSEQHLAWVDEWIGRRGGGLCMVGGPNSFASGSWNETAVGKMLPLALQPAGRDWDDAATTLTPAPVASNHPIWHIASDDARNRALLKTLPGFLGFNRLGPAKAGAEVLARTAPIEAPGIAVQPYGRGRTMAMSTAVTRRYANDFTQSWGGKDARYSKKFWRNVVYWLTENSSIGRRRLLAETDKRLYRPGEPIVLRARTFDENAALTLDYRVAVSIEPKSAADASGDDSPLRRPPGAASPADAKGPFLAWGEEFDLSRVAAETSYTASLPIVDAKSVAAGVALTQGLRIELTAYENNTQVDSTALEVQVLDDPSEQQNPLPDHALLRRISDLSGGTTLRGSGDLSRLIARLPRAVGPPEVKSVPAWSRWPLLLTLLGLLTVEWVMRRRLGLA